MELNHKTLRSSIIEMSALVEKIIELSIDSNVKSKEIYKIEDEINAYHKLIDDSVFKYIALKHPAARDLRMALCVMKMNAELERMGDQAVSIKRYSKKVNQLPQLLQSMFEEVTQMVKSCFEAFVHYDVRAATDVIMSDNDINEFNREVIKKFFSQIKDDETNFEENFSIVRIAKNLERIGDHTTNVAEDVIFLVSGDDVRHTHDPNFATKYLNTEN